MFKTGDRVICVDVSGYDMSHLTLNKVYTVEWVDWPNIRLEGVEFTTKCWRFLHESDTRLLIDDEDNSREPCPGCLVRECNGE